MTNPYLKMLQDDSDQAMRITMMSAVDKQPDVEARIQKLAKDYDLPPDAVRLELPEIEHRSRFDAINYERIAREAPVTAELYRNPDTAAVAWDDWDNLTAIERTLRLGKVGVSGLFAATEGLAGGAEFGVDALRKYVTTPIADMRILPVDIGGPLSQAVQEIRQSQRDWREYLTPKDIGNIESGVYGGMQSLAQSLTILPFAIATRNPGLMLNTLTWQSFGRSYTKGKDKGLPLERAALFGLADAVVERTTETMPAIKLFKDIDAKSSFFKTLRNQLITDLPREQLARAVQDLNEWGVLRPESKFGDYLAERPDAAIQTLIATAVGVGGMVTLVKGVEALGQKKASEAHSALERKSQIEQLDNLAKASKVLPRDSNLVKTMAEQVLTDSYAQAVYIDANTLVQSGLSKEIATLVPDIARQLPDALASNTEIKISKADYLTQIAPSIYAQSLAEHIRVEGEEFTPAQATKYLNEHDKEFQAELEQWSADLDNQLADEISSRNVKDIIKEQLGVVNMHPAQVNDRIATLLSSWYAVMGERIGMSAESLWERYQIAIERMISKEQASGTVNRGEFNPDTRTITLMIDTNLSTFLHESGHLFLELQFDIADNLRKESESTALTESQKQVIKSSQVVLDWLGISDLDTWYAMDFEQKKGFHERYAKGFEAYLLEGKSPNLEMAKEFAGFRAWLLHAYQHLKSYFDDVKLSDDMRQMFDRMLATDEQIALAQHGRSLMPLFANQDKSGMNNTDFAEYQAEWKATGSEAREELALKGVRDMQWLQNAHDSKLKKLQKQHNSLRREIRSEVRMVVHSMPIYRAWKFLTSKIGIDDKLPITKTRSDPNRVEPERDSLFTAIAKLGGIDRQEAVERWNWDQVGRAPTPVFGKPVVRKTGGLSIEHMAENLVKEGYLDVDQHGKFDIHQFEERFDAERRGHTQYSNQFNSTALMDDPMPGSQVLNLLGLQAGRFDLSALLSLDNMTDDISKILVDRKMTARDGLHPDFVAEIFEYSSGDELVRALADAIPPKELIEQLTNQRMLAEHGELSTPEAIKEAANRALYNDARARFVTTEANALAKSIGGLRLVKQAAKEMALNMINRVKVRDLSPSLYSRAEAKAAKAALKAEKAGDIETAAAEKRNQVLNIEATKAAYDAKTEVEKNLKYLKKFDGGGLKQINADHNDQIMAILDRYDLRKMSDAERGRQEKSLAIWLNEQEELDLTPDVPSELLQEHKRIPYKELTIEQFRGLVDTVKQIEHMGREQRKMLVMSQKLSFKEMEQDITEGILKFAGHVKLDNYSAQTMLGKYKEDIEDFFFNHIRAGSIVRILDGGKDNGKVWRYLLKPANKSGEWETTKRAEYARKLSDIMEPVLKSGHLGGKGQKFETIGRSLNRMQVFVMALDMGNDSNMQRLLGGDGWTLEQVIPVVSTLRKDDLLAVQHIWDLFTEFRPLVAEKERRLYGKEPKWLKPRPLKLVVRDADGEMVEVNLRGGYAPVKYDPRASLQAGQHEGIDESKAMLKAAYGADTTRRTYTKNRVDAVYNMPLLLSMDRIYNGLNEVIHDLAWHEWVIDMNKVMRSRTIDSAIRNHYGPDYVNVLNNWKRDNAGGDSAVLTAGEKFFGGLRQNIMAAGLSYNIMSGLIQITGIMNAFVRVGTPWVLRGMLQMMAHPKQTVQFVNAHSEQMKNRARTRFREIAELRSRIQYKSKAQAKFDAAKFWLIVRAQGLVDYPTWLGAFYKALSNDPDIENASALANQAVLDSQGGGETKDLSAFERNKNKYARLFTVYFNFMGTILNLTYIEAKTQKNRGRLAANMLLLFVVPLIIEHSIRAALTPDDKDWDEIDWGKHGHEMLGELADRFLGLFIGVREFKEPIKYALGFTETSRSYEGPTGLRIIVDFGDLVVQAKQGEFDQAFRKSFVNFMGDVTGLPSAQINKTWTGTEALADDETDNPLALVFGHKK